ncbi:flippase-like domain-containing protein [bacterium]|nr:flippase-like domain-containing protein [bacterium]
MNFFKKLIPWLIAAGIFAYLFSKYPLLQVYRVITYVNLWAFISASVAYFVFVYIFDSFVTAKVISHFSHKVGTGEIMKARGLTYLIMIVNYAASQAAFAYYLKRTRNIPILEALGIFFFIGFLDLYWIITLALIGSFFLQFDIAGVDLKYIVQTTALIAYGILIFKIFFWRRGFAKISTRFDNLRFFEWLRGKKIFHIFNQAKVRDYILVWLARLPIMLTIIVFFYYVVQTFGCHIPFVQILCNIPIVYLIGCLPLTPGGLGTTNVAMVVLLSPHLSGAIIENGLATPEELIFALTLLWMFTNCILKGILGTILLRRVPSSLFKATKDVPEEIAEKEAGHLIPNI